MRVPLLDLDIIHQPLRSALDAAIQRVIDSQIFIGGPELEAFEREMLEYIDAPSRDAVGCGSGSDALILALRALDVGVGDEVIVPAQSFTSTATSVDVVGATPVFVDVEPRSLNLDPSRIEAAVTERTAAVIAVHLFGRPADISGIREALARAGRREVPIIEDAAQALGAQTVDGAVGTLSEIACTSFFPTKNLGAFGDAGMVITANAALGERVRVLRAHGAREKYRAEEIGYNSRLDALQAAVLRVKLPHLTAWCDARRANADRYRVLFCEANLSDSVELPPVDNAGMRSIVNQFNLRVRDRDALAAYLSSVGVGTAVYYPRTLPQQPCYAGRGLCDADYPVATAAARDSLAIPVYPGLDADAQRWVVDGITAFYRERGRSI